MPLRHLLYRCPACGRDPVDGDRDQVSCPACGARFARGRGARIAVRGCDRWPREVHPSVLVDRIDALGGPFPGPGPPHVDVVHEARVLTRWIQGERPVQDGGCLLGYTERSGPSRVGFVTATEDALLLRPGRSGAAERWRLADIRSVQTASSQLQLRHRDGRIVALGFPDDSPLRWESLLRTLLSAAWRGAGRDEPAEFQPRIVTAAEQHWGVASRPLPGTSKGPTPPRHPVFYGLVRGLARMGLRLRVDLEVSGVGHVPGRGPFVLLVNHESVLDPILVQAACPRPLHAMTKSTQFGGGAWRRLLVRLQAFPTRRFRVDPQAVRTSLRLLAAGRGVGIFPEGERSWDGRLQAFRRGAMRLVLAAGVPVVPCRLTGSYHLLPRWSRRLRGGPARVAFGPPMSFADEAAGGEGDPVAAVEGRVRRALLALRPRPERGAEPGDEPA